MWHIKSIYAKNLCSFLELQYAPKQGEATLIFGNNLDSDSQNSNGSGKSALIEAISIALTGEPLRKVNTDEIINDTQDAAVVSLVLFNTVLNEQMTIKRMFSRKQPQLIQVCRQTGPYDCDVEEVRQATVADYNKYILDQIGLTKDDIFANFILTARKYKSFLSSSDKEKKEIINRFSNGVLVDESIEKLHEDMVPVQKEMGAAEKEVASCTGSVEALAAEIEKVINESADRKADTESRIQNWKTLISENRAAIRSNNDSISKLEDYLDNLDVLDEGMQALEKGKSSVEELLQTISDRFKTVELSLTTDFAQTIQQLHTQMKEAKETAKRVSDEVAKMRISLTDFETEYNKTSQSLRTQQEENEANRDKCNDRIKKLTAAVKRIQNKGDQLLESQRSKNREKTTLENQLAGVIQCPNCNHEFTLGADLDIAAARANLSVVVAELAQLSKDIANNDAEYKTTVADGKNEREIETALEKERRKIVADIASAEEDIERTRRECAQYEKRIEEAQALVSELQDKQSKIRKRIFDEVFEIIDDAFKGSENQIKSLNRDIEVSKGAIQSYEKAIEDAQNTTEENIIDSLKKSKEQHQENLQAAIAKKNEIEGRLNELNAQEATFIEFKTYLANTKINAIAQITNGFLETIGSDIRVALSGYTILKSGKVRDKISVSLLRDGVDCGSFEKFSAGERVRVELASILSMNQLTNLNCEEGKGLDLLIADEVLDSADEQGLASVFNALNKTQLTSLVVSHGQVHEGYPNKITIVKQNGVSSIYDTNQ